MIAADKDDVVRGLVCSNYNIVLVNNGRAFCNLMIFAYWCCFCAYWPSELYDSNFNQRPKSIDPFWKVINLLFFTISGIVSRRIHKNIEVVFPI